MGDGNRHVGFLRLLLDEAPFDAEVVVGEHAVLAETGLGEVKGAERVFFRCPRPVHENLDRVLGI